MMREQFEYSLINPLLFWSLKTKDEVSVLIGETAAVMVAFDQRNPHHCTKEHKLSKIKALKNCLM